MRFRTLAPLCAALTALLLFAGCGDDDDNERTLTVISHDSFSLDEDLVTAFEDKSGIRVNFLPRGDAGTMLTSVILSKQNPEGDLVFGVDNTLLSRALDEGLFTAYESARLAAVDSALTTGLEGLVTPVDVAYVNLNYDIAALEADGLRPPTSLEEMTLPEWEGKVVVENPASSSPGLAFLLTTVAYFGEDSYLDWWDAMRGNGVVVVDGWETAYYTNFTLAGGSQPVVLSYSTSPAFEQMFAEPAREDSPTGNVLFDGGVFRQVEYAGILKNGDNREEAEEFIDFLLSAELQATIPVTMAVYPVVDDAEVPEAFKTFGAVDVAPAEISPDEIAEKRDEWVAEWTSTVLR